MASDIDIVSAPHRLAAIPPKSLHATIKFNFPIAWIYREDGGELIAAMAGEQARQFRETIRLTGIPD